MYLQYKTTCCSPFQWFLLVISGLSQLFFCFEIVTRFEFSISKFLFTVLKMIVVEICLFESLRQSIPSAIEEIH